MEPEIRYTTTADGVRIAYCEAAEGTPFVEMQPPPWSNIEAEFREWEWHRWDSRGHEGTNDKRRGWRAAL